MNMCVCSNWCVSYYTSNNCVCMWVSHPFIFHCIFYSPSLSLSLPLSLSLSLSICLSLSPSLFLLLSLFPSFFLFSLVWESRFHSLYPDNLISCSQDGSLLHWASLQRHYNKDPHHTVPSSSNDDHIWSHTAIAKGNFEATRLIPESNMHSVNSFDISNKNCVVGVTDGEAMYVLPNIDCH